MPIEREIKVILKNDDRLLSNLELLDNVVRLDIDQIYLPGNGRFRRTRTGSSCKYTFTYKCLIEGDVLEMECGASEDDFQLALKGATDSLQKKRFLISWDGFMWEADFIKFPSGEMFALAECEWESQEPESIPEVLVPYVEFRVPTEHNKMFTNHKLTDEAYARTIKKRYLDGERF